MRQEPNNNTTVANTASGDLGHCEYCGRSTPFTAAILCGLPLGMICTCALEQRAVERVMRALRAGAPIRVEGH